MLYLADVLFQVTDARHVTAHFARPRGILVVAQPLNHRALHSAHHVNLNYCCTALENYL